MALAFALAVLLALAVFGLGILVVSAGGIENLSKRLLGTDGHGSDDTGPY